MQGRVAKAEATTRNKAISLMLNSMGSLILPP
jgi:hypothetical protein